MVSQGFEKGNLVYVELLDCSGVIKEVEKYGSKEPSDWVYYVVTADDHLALASNDQLHTLH